MSGAEVHGPIDYLLIEFPAENLDGSVAAEVLALVEAGIIRLFDVVIVAKADDGSISALAIEDLGDGFAAFAGARSGLIGDEDLDETASVLEPGTVAALLVYENAWAAGFVAAARAVGGEVVSSGRIAAADLMDALDELDTDA